MKLEPELEQESIRQDSLIYSGLIAIGVVMVQPFLTAGSLNLSAKVCVVAFSVAIPLLAALVMVSRQEAFRRRATNSGLVSATKVVGQACACVGVVAGFWHILWIAGVGILVAGLAGLLIHAEAWWRLERDHWPMPQEGKDPRNSGS